MKPVGETLRRALQDRGLELAEVAARTRIARRYLEAIEADDRGSLPSSFFYKSFLHQYASVLSIDTAELDAEIDRVLSEDAPLPLPGQESQVSKDVAPMALVSRAGRFDLRHALASVTALTAVVLGCSGVYLWWHQARQAQATPTAQ